MTVEFTFVEASISLHKLKHGSWYWVLEIHRMHISFATVNIDDSLIYTLEQETLRWKQDAELACENV